jgi:hypothetical protein
LCSLQTAFGGAGCSHQSSAAAKANVALLDSGRAKMHSLTSRAPSVHRPRPSSSSSSSRRARPASRVRVAKMEGLAPYQPVSDGVFFRPPAVEASHVSECTTLRKSVTTAWNAFTRLEHLHQQDALLCSAHGRRSVGCRYAGGPQTGQGTNKASSWQEAGISTAEGIEPLLECATCTAACMQEQEQPRSCSAQQY